MPSATNSAVPCPPTGFAVLLGSHAPDARVRQIVSGQLEPASIMDEREFQKRCDAAFESLHQHLMVAGDLHGFDVEGGSGKLEVIFEGPEEEVRFIVSPNSPVRQIWISALSTSFKLSWSGPSGAFMLEKTGETLTELMSRILTEQLGTPVSV